MQICRKLYTMLDYERDEIIMKSSISHGVTQKNKRGTEARKGKDSAAVVEEGYHETIEPNTTVSDSSLPSKIRMMERNKGSDSNIMTCKSEVQEKLKIKEKEKEKESIDLVTKSKSKASRRLQSLKCSLLSSPTRRKILLQNRNDLLLLQFERTQPSLVNADCSLLNTQDPTENEESILNSVQSTTAAEKNPEGFSDPALSSIEAVTESIGLGLGLVCSGDLQGVSQNLHPCTISVESRASDLETVKSSRNSTTHGILRRTKDSKVFSQIQLKSTHGALKSFTESPYRCVQIKKTGITLHIHKQDIPKITVDEIERKSDTLSLSSVKHEHEQMQQHEGVVTMTTEGKRRKRERLVTQLNQRASASKALLTKRNKQTSAKSQDGTPIRPQVLEVHRRSVTENKGDGGEKKEEDIIVGGDGSLAHYFAEQQDFDRNEEGEGSGVESREVGGDGEEEEEGAGDIDIIRGNIIVTEGVDLEEVHRIEMHESIDTVFEQLHQQEFDTQPHRGPSNGAMRNNFIQGGELDAFDDIKELELHQPRALRTTASSVCSRTIAFPNTEDSANAARHIEEAEFLDYAHVDNVQGASTPMVACYEGQTVCVYHEADLNDDQDKKQADFVDDCQDEDGGDNSPHPLASQEVDQSCTHHSFKRRSNSELNGVMRPESSAYLIAQRDLGLHPDTQRDLGLHPETESRSSSNLHLGAAA